MKAASSSCAVFAATTYSKTLSMSARSVNRITRTPLPDPTCSSCRSVVRDRLAVIVASGALTFGDCEEQRRCRGPCRLKAHGDGAGPGRIEAYVGFQTSGERSLRQVLDSAAERDVKMVVVRVDDRATPRQIGGDHDGLILRLERPALGVVAGRSERRVAHQLADQMRTVAALSERASQGAGDVLFCGARGTGDKRWRKRSTGDSTPDDLPARQQLSFARNTKRRTFSSARKSTSRTDEGRLPQGRDLLFDILTP